VHLSIVLALKFALLWYLPVMRECIAANDKSLC
jgi:hypothetical protein